MFQDVDAINHYAYNYYWKTCSASIEISLRMLEAVKVHGLIQ